MNWKNISIIIAVLLLGITAFILFPYITNKKQTDETDEDIDAVTIAESDIVDMQLHVPTDGILYIPFDQRLSHETITTENILVTDDKNKPTDISVKVTEEDFVIVIEPPAEGYKKDTTYTITLTDIAYATSQKIEEPHTYTFRTVRDEVAEAVLHPDIKQITKENVQSFDDKKLVITNDGSRTFAFDDILIVDTDNPYAPDGEAIKITDINEKRKTIELTYIQPYFEELFESLDLYQSYDFTEAEIDLLDNEPYVETYQTVKKETDTALASTLNQTFKKKDKFKLGFSLDEPLGEKNVFGFKIEDLVFPLGDTEIELSGDIQLIDPTIHPDIQLLLGKPKKFDIMTTTGVDTNTKIKLSQKKETKKEKKEEVYTKDLGIITLPSGIAGVLLHAEIALEFHFNASGEVEMTVEVDSSYEYERGIVLLDGKPKFISKSDGDFSFAATGSVKFALSTGVEFSVGLKAYAVATAEFFVKPTATLDGEVKAGMNSELDKKDKAFFCGKYEYATTFKSGFRAGIEPIWFLNKIFDEVTGEFAFPSSTTPLYTLNNCQELTGFITDEKEIEMAIGDTYYYPIQGEYINVISNDKKKAKLAEEAFTFSVSDHKAIDVYFNPTDQALYIEALQASDTDTLTLGITYEEISMELPITIMSDKKEHVEVSAKEAEDEEELVDSKASQETTLSETEINAIVQDAYEVFLNHTVYEAMQDYFAETDDSDFLTEEAITYIKNKTQNQISDAAVGDGIDHIVKSNILLSENVRNLTLFHPTTLEMKDISQTSDSFTFTQTQYSPEHQGGESIDFIVTFTKDGDKWKLSHVDSYIEQ